MTESLSDKLKALGVNLGAGNHLKSSRQNLNEVPIEQVLSGSDHETIYGKTFQFVQNYPKGYALGNILLGSACNLDMLFVWANKTQSSSSRLEVTDFIFLDAETSGLAGGTGTFAFLLGLGFYSPNGFQVIQLFMRDPSQETALLASLTHYFSRFKGVITFNGKSFDIPLLNGRHILHGLTSPFKDLFHIDLLPLSRRIWHNRLDDRSLKNLEIQILGLTRTQEEVPGWMVPEIYFDYLKTKDARPLSGVFYHNLQDIVSLAALFQYTSEMLLQPFATVDPHCLDLIAIARIYEEAGFFDQAIRIYEHSLKQGLPEEFFIQTLMRYADIFRKQQNWISAIQLWERAAGYNQLTAGVELSKYYEHHAKDYSRALYWAEKSYEWVTNLGIPSNKQKLEDLLKRKARLWSKINCSGSGNGD
jgi:uncharacterized protein YprB with RNaseH-like and TPR domain